MDKKTRAELIEICKTKGIRGYTGKKKEELLQLISSTSADTIQHVSAPAPAPALQAPGTGEIHKGDVLTFLPTLAPDSAQIVIADPPYNIGKDFGNNSDKMPMPEYLAWCDTWIAQCLRILKPNGTMFIFGFSEILALILARIPTDVNRRWLIWHYTNKNVASLNFWQRSHESILVLWKADKVFNRDDVREPYTEGFLNGAAGRTRTATAGRFSNGDKATTYTAHPAGALPRDVIKVPALAGGAGMKERVDHPTQKPLALCERLLRSCRQADGYVFVPFAGSGSECLAAKGLGLPYIGVELNPEYVTLARARLNPPAAAAAATATAEATTASLVVDQ